MSNRTPKEALREIRNRIVYMYGNIDGTFNPPALKEVCEIADDAISSPITEKSSAVGNAAALREALETIHDKVNRLDEECGVDPVEIRDIARAVLAAPPRQCDMGTPDEQAQRFHDFCAGNSSGINGMCKPTCPCIDCFDKCQCFAKWAQTPYEAEEGAGE